MSSVYIGKIVNSNLQGEFGKEGFEIFNKWFCGFMETVYHVEDFRLVYDETIWHPEDYGDKIQILIFFNKIDSHAKTLSVQQIKEKFDS